MIDAHFGKKMARTKKLRNTFWPVCLSNAKNSKSFMASLWAESRGEVLTTNNTVSCWDKVHIGDKRKMPTTAKIIVGEKRLQRTRDQFLTPRVLGQILAQIYFFGKKKQKPIWLMNLSEFCMSFFFMW